MRRTKLVGDRLHIRNRCRRCTQSETTMSGSQYCGIVVFAHYAIRYENRVKRHRNGLYDENCHHRQSQ